MADLLPSAVTVHAAATLLADVEVRTGLMCTRRLYIMYEVDMIYRYNIISKLGRHKQKLA